MIQDYFGEETVWKLLANNPYEKNNAQGITLRYRATSFEENEGIAIGFLQAIPRRFLVDIIKEDAPKSWRPKEHWSQKVFKEIRVKNVFGNESKVIIMNM